MFAALIFTLAAGETPGPCADRAGPLTRAPNAAELQMIRRFVHDVARREGVDPYALEAIGMVETGFIASIGAHCEVGHFQIMPRWAPVFRLDSPRDFFDPRVGAIAAARIYRHGWQRWQPRYERLGGHRCFGGAKKSKLDRLVFSALVYNYGRAPRDLAKAKDLAKVELPSSACAYARRFKTELARARKRGPI
jgi:hypothetical protein